ncbi:MAG TPA: hypothetical protein PLZ75_14105, partial [Bacteroidales bacterium]|nr:hypothetical protein [Bacteroidales bacterium]
SIIWLFSGGILFFFYFYGFGAENEQVVNIEGIPCVEMKIAFHGKKNTSILPFESKPEAGCAGATTGRAITISIKIFFIRMFKLILINSFV